uniref:Endonuclease III homolog n=1 Tax=Acartia pacifica TaxID=335913 RepID=A0A0U2TGQ3_ACAPC|nr:endonuclease III-like protein 1 [Acartia pacifica]
MDEGESPYFIGVNKTTKKPVMRKATKRSLVKNVMAVANNGQTTQAVAVTGKCTPDLPEAKPTPVDIKCEEDKFCLNVANGESKQKKGKRKHIKAEIEMSDDSTSTSAWAPQNWELVFDNIRKMREGRTAPVDTMGCERAHDPDASPAVMRFQCLISLMLSSQTKDEVNYAAMTRLREHGLTVQNIIDTTEAKVGELIYPVGFWKTKAKFIKEVCLALRDKYDCDIPRNVPELCKLKGVGPKMAHICMSSAWNEPSGIGVDTHVHRISGRLGWTEKECKIPEATRVALESWMPRDRWIEVNWLLVGFGQELCRPVGPKCGDCLNKDLCPTGRNWTPSPKKKASPQKSVKK